MAAAVGTGVTVIRNPATGEEVGTAPQAGAAEAAEAIARAAEAFPGWWETPAAARGAIVRAGAEAVLARRDELAQQLTLEQGKPLRESRLEIARFVHTLEHYAGLAKSLRGGYVPSLDVRTHGLVVKRPLGVVVGDRAVELPDDPARQQARPGARVRQHARREAGRDDAADDGADRRDHAARQGFPTACSR